MVDTQMDIVHFYRKANDLKPYQSLSLNHGFLLSDLAATNRDAVAVADNPEQEN